MKVNELRVGNLIQLYRKPEDNRMKPYKVAGIFNNDSLGGYCVMLTDDFIVNIDTGIVPVPLTEDWLVKFGFEKSGLYWFKGCVYIWEWGIHNPTFNSQSMTNDGDYNIEFKYVHQLQNYYFANMNGEELELTEVD